MGAETYLTLEDIQTLALANANRVSHVRVASLMSKQVVLKKKLSFFSVRSIQH